MGARLIVGLSVGLGARLIVGLGVRQIVGLGARLGARLGVRLRAGLVAPCDATGLRHGGSLGTIPTCPRTKSLVTRDHKPTEPFNTLAFGPDNSIEAGTKYSV